MCVECKDVETAVVEEINAVATMSQFLIQILVPTLDGRGQQVTRSRLEQLAQILTDRFGGVTSYLHAPAEGLWRDRSQGGTAKDEIIVLEVMANDLDVGFWRPFRAGLETDFAQQKIMMRASRIELL